MTAKQLLLVAVVLVAVWFLFADGFGLGSTGLERSAEGFTKLPMAEDQEGGRVYVMIPPDCPSDKAARGRSVVRALAEAGIPVEVTSSYNARMGGDDPMERYERVKQVLDKGPPLVFINGYAKSDPSVAAVKAQYRSVAAH